MHAATDRSQEDTGKLATGAQMPMDLLTRGVQKRLMHRDRKQAGAFQGLLGGHAGKSLISVVEFLCWLKKFWKRVLVLALNKVNVLKVPKLHTS